MNPFALTFDYLTDWVTKLRYLKHAKISYFYPRNNFIAKLNHTPKKKLV